LVDGAPNRFCRSLGSEASESEDLVVGADVDDLRQHARSHLHRYDIRQVQPLILQVAVGKTIHSVGSEPDTPVPHMDPPADPEASVPPPVAVDGAFHRPGQASGGGAFDEAVGHLREGNVWHPASVPRGAASFPEYRSLQKRFEHRDRPDQPRSERNKQPRSARSCRCAGG
jgi:hypothetical protein